MEPLLVKSRRVALCAILAAAAVGALVLCLVSFTDYGETDLSLPPCSRDLCALGSTARCRYTDSPCRGRYCNKRCDEWYDAVVANDGVPFCTCERFCAGACYTPTCASCSREDLPIWIRDIAGPLGTGLLCCPLGGSPGNPEPCCAQGHAKKYGRCCELEAPKCECSWAEPVTLHSFNPDGIGVTAGLLALAVAALPVLLVWCWRPLPQSLGPRGADLALVAAYLVALLAAAFQAKRRWQLSFKPQELLPAGAFGTLAAFGFAVVLLPLDRTHVLFRLTSVPFDRTVKFHRWSGRTAVLLVVVHGVAELFTLGIREMFTLKQEPWGLGNALGSLAGFCSVGLLVLGIGAVRRASYELFLIAHRVLAALIYISGALHCFAFATMAAVSLLLHGAGWVARLCRRSRVCRVAKAERLGAAEVDGEALCLQVDLAGSGVALSGRFAPGTWFLLQVPGSGEWHPYSLAAEGEGTASFLVKHMGEGSWSAGVVSQPPSAVRVEGPYGGPGFATGHCSSMVLVGGGVGLSPLARLWQHPPEGVTSVELIWVVRSPEAVDWLTALLPDLVSGRRMQRAIGGSIRIFVTRQAIRQRLPSPTWSAGVTADDAMVGSQQPTHQPAEHGDPRDGSSAILSRGLQQAVVASCGDSAVSLEDDVEWSRQSSWEESKQATEQRPDLVRRAAALSWDSSAPPERYGSLVTLHAGRPDLGALFAELSSGAAGNGWGVMACGPHMLVSDARRCAAAHQMRFHSEEFAW